MNESVKLTAPGARRPALKMRRRVTAAILASARGRTGQKAMAPSFTSTVMKSPTPRLYMGQATFSTPPIATANYSGRLSDLDDGSESTLGQEGEYTGFWDKKNNRPHGAGKMVWDNGITYKGEWRDGQYHGIGSKLYSRGGGYKGQWSHGKRQGTGTHLFAGKFGYDRWEGPFESDQMHGMGTMHYADGTNGEFEFKLGKPMATEREGHYDSEVSGLDDGSPSTIGVGGRYKGGWDEEAAVPEGFGVMRWENGISYKGMWKAGRYHGHGRKLYSRGGGYEGGWHHGKREGAGVSFYDGLHGLARWEGTFEADKPHGWGQLYYPPDLEAGGDEHGRWEGDIAIKGPKLEFINGKPMNQESLYAGSLTGKEEWITAVLTEAGIVQGEDSAVRYEGKWDATARKPAACGGGRLIVGDASLEVEGKDGAEGISVVLKDTK